MGSGGSGATSSGDAAAIVEARSRVVRVRDAWIELLSRLEWEWFATLTFREHTHPESADKRFRVWVSELNRQAYGVRWSKRKVMATWVRALEYQLRGVLHFHALLRGVGEVRRLAAMDRWFALAGIARVLPVRQQEAVRAYCSKYVVKGGELEVGGAWDEASRERGDAARGWRERSEESRKRQSGLAL